jgi:pimeloyl-ACP methyl ester carboxylesterase
MTIYLSDKAETSSVGTAHATYAYRRFGVSGGVPLVLTMRFRGTIDHWDPAFLEELAKEREVIVFDNRGIGFSTGEPATSIEGLVEGAIDFVTALGLSQVDLLGWSMGGFVAQGIALTRPDLVRRLVVAGSAPGGVPDMPQMSEKTFTTAVTQDPTDETYLYLFWPENDHGRAKGLETLRRLDYRLDTSHAAVSPEAVQGQVNAILTNTGYWDRLTELTLPVLVANGGDDVMIHAYGSYAMSQRLPHAKVVLYSDAGHGFLFQHHQEFGQEVTRFLR